MKINSWSSSSTFLKQAWPVMGDVLKSKSGAVKSKAEAIRTRLIILSLLNNKFLLSDISQKFHAMLKHENVDIIDVDQPKHHVNSISQKLNSLFGPRKFIQVRHKISKKIHVRKEDIAVDDCKGAIVVYNHLLSEPPTQREHYCNEEEEEEDNYLGLTNSIFDCEFLNPNLSVVEIVKQWRSDSENEFVLEDEIDQVSDLFIKRFHRQMRMQKD